MIGLFYGLLCPPASVDTMIQNCNRELKRFAGFLVAAVLILVVGAFLKHPDTVAAFALGGSLIGVSLLLGIPILWERSKWLALADDGHRYTKIHTLREIYGQDIYKGWKNGV